MGRSSRGAALERDEVLDPSVKRAGRRPGCRKLVRLCRIILAVFLVAMGLAVGLPLAMRLWVQRQASPYIFRRVGDVPPQQVAVVFGAAVYRNDRLSPMLRDRVETAVELYQAGKVSKILMSGDNRFVHYNEPGAMVKHAEALGVPQADLQPDFAGRRTYDTCYRAREIFGLEDVVLVTQGFHLPRAVYTCRSMGLNAVGMEASRNTYSRASEIWYELREILATVMAWWDLHVRKPVPVLGEPIPLG